MTWAEALLAEREEDRRSAERGARERVSRAVGELFVAPKRGSLTSRTNVLMRAAEIADENATMLPSECMRQAILSVLQDSCRGPELTPAELDLARKRIGAEWSWVGAPVVTVYWKEDPNG